MPQQCPWTLPSYLSTFALTILLTATLSLADDTTDAPELTPEQQLEQLAGTWTRKHINVDGEPTTITWTVRAGEKAGQFEHTFQMTTPDKSNESLWEAKFIAEVTTRDLLTLEFVENRRILPKEEAHDWRPFDFSVIAQIKGNRLFATWDLEQETHIWTKKTAIGENVAPEKIDVLEPLLKTYQGSFENPGSEAYGADKAVYKVQCSGKRSATGSVITHNWTMQRAGTSADQVFEVRAVYSYNAKTGRVVKQYQTSSGVMIRGELVAANNGKLLWERSGEGPAGKIHEFCQFDFSEPGVFRHTIISRTLNGVPVDEDEPVIVLKAAE